MGAPAKEIRLMVGLKYLKYMYNESDEMMVQKFVENPYYQYFCGNEYFELVEKSDYRKIFPLIPQIKCPGICLY